MDDTAVAASPSPSGLRDVAVAGDGGPPVSAAVRPVDVTVIVATPFWSGHFERCARRVLHLIDRSAVAAEVLIALEGRAPTRPEWLDHPAVRVVATSGPSGPAAARNLAARSARGRILLFVDAEVELGDGAIDRVSAAFDGDPDLVGLVGAYDDDPPATGTVSVFRALLHHHIHATHAGPVDTFWSGCGAVRTAAFLDIGGFDESRACPSIEDIDLGTRIATHGGRILLLPELTCKNLKRWTLASMVLTDVRHRAVPWTRLIMSKRVLPASLNLDWRGRTSALVALVLAACLVGTVFAPQTAWGLLACGLALAWLNRDFYALCARKHGAVFAASAAMLHWLYFLYSALTFAAVAAWEVARGLRRPPRVPAGTTGLSPAGR